MSSTRAYLATGAVLAVIGAAAAVLVWYQLDRGDEQFAQLTSSVGNHRVHRVDSTIVRGRPVVFRGDTVGRLVVALSAEDIGERPQYGPGWSGTSAPPPAAGTAPSSTTAPDVRIVYFADLTRAGRSSPLRDLRPLSARMEVEGRGPVVVDTTAAPDSVSAQLWLGRGDPLRIALALDGPVTRLAD